MTTEQLENVENFTVENKYGKIVWKGHTDLTEVDVDRDVMIKKG